MRAEGGEVEKKTFDCCDCGKKYSFLHKLQHHQTWSCKKEKEGETCMLSSPRRIGSQNCFFLPPTPEKCENGDVEYEGESNSKEVFFCDVCERSFLSKNARKKHSTPVKVNSLGLGYLKIPPVKRSVAIKVAQAR